MTELIVPTEVQEQNDNAIAYSLLERHGLLSGDENNCPKCDYAPILHWFNYCPMCVHKFGS